MPPSSSTVVARCPTINVARCPTPVVARRSNRRRLPSSNSRRHPSSKNRHLALEALKDAWQNTRLNWVDGSEPCDGTWIGITCTDDRVTSISLASMQLTGGLPDDIEHLTELETLSLNLNGFTGHIPASIGKLEKLSWLDLSQNNLNGSIPVSNGIKSGLDMLTSAIHLDLGDNKLSGDIPPQLFSSSMRLTHLDLSHNRLNGTLDISMNPSNQLQLLDLRNNEITEFTQRHQYSIGLILADNPICKGPGVTDKYCFLPANTNKTYSTPTNNCVAPSCGSGLVSSPNCICALPYEGSFFLKASSFLDLENPIAYNSLHDSMMNFFQKAGVAVDSVSLENPRRNSHDYLVINLEVFPHGAPYFNWTGISAIGYAFSSQTFKLKRMNTYVFDAENYNILPGHKSSNIGVIIGSAVGGCVLVILLVLVIIYATRRKGSTTQQNSPFALWDPTSGSGGVPELKGTRSFTLEELKKYTNNFSENNSIGAGGYGMVYRGSLPNGELVAIKRAQHGSSQGGLEFKTEIELLSRVHHKNVVGLIGFCFDHGEHMLVYEYIVNGNLKDSLLGRSGIRLDWMRRLKIAFGAGQGLQYLHDLANPPIIHRDIKTNNILLDARLVAKVADFGLSKPLSDGTHVTTQVKGTMGYMDPEYYMTQQLTEKSDVYSFGIVMLELITARNPIDKGKYIVREVKETMNKSKELYGLYEILDPTIGSSNQLMGLERFVDLSLRCVEETGIQRPTMSEVVKELESIMELARLNPDIESSSSTSTSYERRGYDNNHSYSNDSLFSSSGDPTRIKSDGIWSDIDEYRIKRKPDEFAYLALEALKDAWQNTRLNWVDGSEPCDGTWVGITCTDDRVTSMSLNLNGFTGHIPASIGKLEKLSWLDLSQNNLIGSIPVSNGIKSGLDMLTSAIHLDLGDNKLSGDIPPQLFSSNMRLTHLDLSHNRLNDTLDISMNPSNQLQLLDLRNNEITDFTQRNQYSIGLTLADNPICKGAAMTDKYCFLPVNTNKTYSTPTNNCVAPSCGSGLVSSPNCICANPYEGSFFFKASSFLDLENPIAYNSLHDSMMNFFQKAGMAVDSVSLENPRRNSHDYLVINLEVFPHGAPYFNWTGISAIGYAFSSQAFKLKRMNTYVFDAENYNILPGHKSSNIGVIIGSTVGGCVLVILLVLAVIYAIRRKGSTTRQDSPFALWDPSSGSGGVPELKGTRSFTLEELKKYTNNFSENNSIGAGGYGMVYRGSLPNGELVAIKRSQQGSSQGGLEFKTEIELLSRVHQKNVVSLIGFCFDHGEQMLVYEYIVNGSLKNSLLGRSGIRLDWMRRLKIAFGAGQGLQYLHDLANPPIIHRDIKTNNILLDARLVAKVADFGLSKPLSDGTYVTTQVKGTMGYMDPEYYMTQQLTEKSDVYSFGIVMLELITARNPIEKGKYVVREVKERMNKSKELYGLYDILDPTIGSSNQLMGLERFVDLSLRCVEETGIQRPTMSEVVKELESIMELAGLNPDIESSSSTSTSYERRGYDYNHPYSNDNLFSSSGGYLPPKLQPK
ncbi:hypothetical protein OSB04_014484 [Centaurea solstitialis]|uniref:non-specific serine/threonine protein kinase n=1 Tax=Centaurea solstitialis TaxID=347529 RepID=A0AA38SX64_9ASTR|nr:hypothetical protein OSB04_014484 [Centaurea solstitialis]